MMGSWLSSTLGRQAGMSSYSKYLALLRGVNVGGNSLVKMAELQVALLESGFVEVKTYIQSGNVLFRSEDTNKIKLGQQISQVIVKEFGVTSETVVFAVKEWQEIVKAAPNWWGQDPAWKHNLLVLLPPYDMQEVVKAVGVLKPAIEKMSPGNGVLYQSMSRELLGRTTTGKLASNPIYKRMTIRNYNTAMKLVELAG